MNEELCFICDEPTGRAGKADDSMYDSQGEGPYCEDCWVDAPKEDDEISES